MIDTEKELEQAKILLQQYQDMRTAQKSYFAARKAGTWSNDLLATSKQLERSLDKGVKGFLSDQKTLF